MEEDFIESEVLWPDDTQKENENENENKVKGVKKKNKVSPLPSSDDDYYWRLEKIPMKKNKTTTASMPLDIIPVKVTGDSRIQDDIYKTKDDDDGKRGEEMVPPHLMMIRKRNYLNNQMAFSVCYGNGRTLKGRDLCRVRNSVLRMTGFLETC
ncbi:hypothetical protein C5167_036754 [Papaver somniferum]|uniref:Uncharacterized protein n=2 Tax=Papaver somniferum TaxID=3469 RepID=A0A4Y7I8I1_PAPSO|nr:hypothetical protein C5167_036754 [Papaver somniferum]